MARARRIIYAGNQNTSTDYRPIVSGAAHYAYVGGVKIPWWVAQTQQPSPKITSQPTGSIGISGGYTSGNYTIYCSGTRNANSYGAWRAFDGSYSDAYGWASQSSGDKWLGILLPVGLKSISITIRNRTRSSIVAGPISGTFYGSDTVTLSGTAIGTFSGRPGSTSAAGWTVACNNHNDSYRFIRIAIATHDNSGSYCAIGEMYIDGKRAA